MPRSVALIAVFLVYLMIPGSLELTESLAHVALHGDAAHGDREGHTPSDGADEHGCSGGYHLCVCHHATGFLLPLGVDVERPLTPLVSDLVSAIDIAPCADLGRIFRPPIA